MKTTELHAKKTAGKRYSDTSLLIFSFLAFPITGLGSGSPTSIVKEGEEVDPRFAIAVARINWIHSKYGGKIVSQVFIYNSFSTTDTNPFLFSCF